MKTNCSMHTKGQPMGYTQWHAWAEGKSKHHIQVKCDQCGLYKIWRRKARKGDTALPPDKTV